MRAISTVLDVALFVLLVSAAVGTLTLAGPPTKADSSVDETADVLATSTLSVEYELRGQTRHAHGTVGTMLAKAAVADATVRGRSLSGVNETFTETVRAETRGLLRAPNRTQIVTRWSPYRDALLRGTLTIGPQPPDGVDVHSATLTVSVPVPASHERATTGAADGYEAVARPVATAVTDGLFPDNRVDASVFRESPTSIATSTRFRRIDHELDADVTAPLAGGSVGVAHDRVTTGLTDAFARELQARFDTPDAAAETVQTGTVHITVRRWEA